MSRAAMSRAAQVAAADRAVADVATRAGSVAADQAAVDATTATAARITHAIDAVTGHGAMPGSTVQLTTEEWDHRELLRLVESYPIGAAVSFQSYDPTIRPRDWRRAVASAPWSLKRGDALQVVGYAGDIGFPEGLSVRRNADGPDGPAILVFPAELRPTQPTTAAV